MQEFLLNHSHVKLILDNEKKRSFAQADVNTIIALLAPPDDRRETGLDQTARFVMFKAPFEDILRADVFKQIESAAERRATDQWRICVFPQRQLLEEGLQPDETDEDADQPKATAKKSRGPLIKTACYIGNKWGGKYLRAPEIYFAILEQAGEKFKTLGSLCRVEGYIHDNNTGPGFPPVYFLKSVKNTDTIAVSKKSPGVFKYGVRRDGNSRLVAPILFPRTFGDRHIVVWNPEGVLGKEFYKVIPHDEGSALPTAAQLNCTFGILQREILGLVNLGEGGLKFSADDVRMFLVVPMQPSEELERVFLNLATRIQKTVLDEIRQPDRRALDEVVFDVLGLDGGRAGGSLRGGGRAGPRPSREGAERVKDFSGFSP